MLKNLKCKDSFRCLLLSDSEYKKLLRNIGLGIFGSTGFVFDGNNRDILVNQNLYNEMHSFLMSVSS